MEHLWQLCTPGCVDILTVHLDGGRQPSAILGCLHRCLSSGRSARGQHSSGPELWIRFWCFQVSLEAEMKMVMVDCLPSGAQHHHCGSGSHLTLLSRQPVLRRILVGPNVFHLISSQPKVIKRWEVPGAEI